jgi:hypothetical protein
MTRELGWHADPPHRRPKAQYAAPLGMRLSDLRPWSVKQFVQGISDQGELSACTGVSTVRCIQTWDAAHGVKAPVLGSALAAYWGGRLYDFLDGKPGSAEAVAAFISQDSDGGSSHSAVFAAMSDLGLPPEEAWPYDDVDSGSPADRYRRRPDGNAERLGYDARAPLTVQALDGAPGEANARILALNHAGMAGSPVALGLLVDEPFVAEAFDPAKAYTPNIERSVGGHALYIVAMRVGAGGAREYQVAMSWGVGAYAFVWLSEAAILAPSTQLTLVQRAPVVSAASDGSAAMGAEPKLWRIVGPLAVLGILACHGPGAARPGTTSGAAQALSATSVPVSSIAVKTAPSCADACAQGRALKCPFAEPSPGGASCEARCNETQKGIAPYNLACRASAPSCPAMDACEAPPSP